MQPKLGVIGGTGFYDLAGLEVKGTFPVQTPFGDASDEFVIGEIGGKEIIFLPRHGKGHRLNPSVVNYRANIWGMKKFGVTHLVTISAVGSFREEIKPGSLVFVDQYFDRTKTRGDDTFFSEGIAVHISFAEPVCPVLHRLLAEIASQLAIEFHSEGVYLNIEGPAFSTRAESRIYRTWGADVVGMTNLYEAKLAREAELHFASIAEVTDYDSWRAETVDVPTVLANLGKANAAATKVLLGLIDCFPPATGKCSCESALAQAIVTRRDYWTDEIKGKYDILLEKYL